MKVAVASPVAQPLTPAPRGLIQRCGCGGTPGPDGECAECKRKRLMRFANGPGPASPTPLVDAVVRTPGQPLDPGTRTFMEARFGSSSPPASPRPALAASGPVSRPGDPLEREAHRVAGDVLSRRPPTSGGGVDFSRVRVHTDERAAASARSVDANAYTVGSHIVFDRGRYAPATPSGRALIAHELAHVVQQGDAPAAAILRQPKCTHDGPPKGCGHAWKFEGGPYDPADPRERFIGVDRMIVDSFAWNLPGTWAREVEAPLNVIKSAKESGRVDGLRVIESGPSMRFEVVEIKSRAKGEHGGCIRASLEAYEYVRVYNRISSRIVQLSQIAEQLGGLPVRNASSLTRGQVRALQASGFDLEHPDNWDAARFFFSLQNKLNNRVFTRQFASVEFDVFRGGETGTNYSAITVRKDCVTAKGRKREGLVTLIFQVNQEGGVSYRCSTSCPEDDERRRRPQPEVQPDVRAERGSEARRVVEVEGDESIDEPRLPDQPPLEAPPPEQPSRQPQDRPGVKKQPPVQAPPVQQPSDQPVQQVDEPQIDQPGGRLHGVPELIVTLAAINQWRKSVRLAQQAGKLSAASAAAMERQLAKQTIEVIDEIGKKAPDIAKKLNGKNVAKYGTDAADDLLKAGAQEVDDLVAQSAKRGGKKVLGALRTLGRVAGVLGVLFTASEVYAMGNHLRKGGDIRIGFGGPEAELVGETKITKRGQQFGQKLDISGSGTLKDTIVDIDVTGLPDLSGKAEMHAENVTIRQAGLLSNGDPITVNIRAKLKNTTIVIKHRARFKDGKAVIGGEAVDISDSNIEIDLPEGAIVPEGTGGKPMSNVNLKITEVPKDPSAHRGPAGEGGAGGPEATPTPTPTPAAKPEEKPKPEPDPAAKYKDLDDETREKIRTASKPVQTLFEDVTKPVDPKKKGIPVTNDTVKRFYDTVPKDLTDAQLEALRKRMVPLATDDVEAWFKGLADAVEAVQKPADAAVKKDEPAKDTPGTAPQAPQDKPEKGEAGMTPAEIFDMYENAFKNLKPGGWVIDWSAAEKAADKARKKGEKVKLDRNAVFLSIRKEDAVKLYAPVRVRVLSVDRRARKVSIKLLNVGKVIDPSGASQPRPGQLNEDVLSGKLGW